MLWLLLLRKGNLSHSTAIDQLGGLQPVPLSLGSGLSHLTVGNIYLTGVHMNAKALLVLIFGAQP